MMRKTYETSYQTSIKPPAPCPSAKKVVLVPRLMMPKTGNQAPQQITLTPVKSSTKENSDSQGNSCYLDLESLRRKFQTEINAKITLPAGPLFSDEEPRYPDEHGASTAREGESARRTSTSRSKNRDRISNVAIRASRANLQGSLLKNHQPKGSVSIEDSQSEFHANEAHPFHVSRETRQKATLGNLKKSSSLKSGQSGQSQRDPIFNEEPSSPEHRPSSPPAVGTFEWTQPWKNPKQDDLETSRHLKSAQKKYSSKVVKSIPCLAYYVEQNEKSGQPSDNFGFGFDFIGQPPGFHQPSKQKKESIVLYFHTNGEDLSDLDWIGELILKTLNLSFLAVEYPGYGLYEGSVSEATMMEDAEVILNFIKEELRLDPEHVVVVGRSLGSGPAVHLAANYNIKGLVLISAFTSIRDVVKDKVGSIISCLISERFKNLEKISLSQCPVCIVHGKEDTVVNKEHGNKLASKFDF